MLYGRVGLVSLGQVAPYGIGCWICMRFAYATDLPYPLLVLFGGIGAAIFGTLIGLPALRVSGLYLALVTLMLAAAVETLLFQFGFPNGGTGFKGVADNLSSITPLRRPSFAETDDAYFRFVVVATVILFVAAWWALHRKPGRAWASVMQSEPSALTAGIDITRYKLVVFTLASFMAGCAGGLFAGSVQSSIGARRPVQPPGGAVPHRGGDDGRHPVAVGRPARRHLRQGACSTCSCRTHRAVQLGTTSACRCSGSVS